MDEIHDDSLGFYVVSVTSIQMSSGRTWYLVSIIVLLLAIMLPQLARAEDSAETPTIESSTTTVIHTVASGDTLFSIAAQYETTIFEIGRLNSLQPDSVLQIGQTLIIAGIVPLPLGTTLINNPALLNVPGLPSIPKLHTIQGGESLMSIAAQYDVTVSDLQLANDLNHDNTLQIGQSLLIPDRIGDLLARDYVVRVGDTLAGIALQFNSQPDLLLADKMVVNPDHLVAGQSIRIISRTGSAEPTLLNGVPHIVRRGDTLASIAARHNQSPQVIAAANGLIYPAPIVVGQRLRIPSEGVYRELSAEIITLNISSNQLRQGESFALYIELASSSTPTGRLRFTDIIETPLEPWLYTEYEQEFPFAPLGNGFIAIVGLDAFTHPGLYELQLFIDDDDIPDFAQTVSVDELPYGFQAIPLADAVEIRKAEDMQLTPIYETYNITNSLSFTMPLQQPVDNAFRSAGYGAARSYADAPVRGFHSGVDFAAPQNTPVQAVADGTVVFSDFTQLRGYFVILDHGLGVKTSYAHMAATLVQVGQSVTMGTAIGSVGNTGLSTGAHLHWDVRIRNIPVNGLQWLSQPIFAEFATDQAK